MATWTDLTDAVLTSGKAWTQLISRAVRDNVIALAEGASGAPKIIEAAIDDGAISQLKIKNSVTGTIVTFDGGATSDTDITSLTKVTSIHIPYGGVFSVQFELQKNDGLSGDARGQIHINGVAEGVQRITSSTSFVTYTEDITLVAGEFLELFVRRTVQSGFVNTRHFHIRENISRTFTLESF